MSRSKEPFAPRPDQADAVSMYVCGVTVYSMSHIGEPVCYESCFPHVVASVDDTAAQAGFPMRVFTASDWKTRDTLCSCRLSLTD